VLSMFLRMRNATGRSMTYIYRSVDDIHTNRVGIDLASTGLAALAPIIHEVPVPNPMKALFI